MNNNNSNIKFLSEAATNEIEGDDLCFLIAFNKKGEIVPYYRHIETINEECCQFENPLNFIEISFKDLDDGFSNVPMNTLLGDSFKIPPCYSYRIMRKALLCDPNDTGKWKSCSPKPCP